MNNLKHNLKIFYLFSKFSMETTFQGRFGIVFFIIGKIIRFLFYFFLIYFIFTKAKFIKGYTLNQAIIFYLTFNIIDTSSQILFREVYRFRPMIVSGSFNLILIKPYHPFLQILVGGVDFLDLLLLLPYFGLTLFFILKIPDLFPLFFILYFLLLINSLLIATAFHIGVLALGVMTTEIDHLIMIYRDVTNLGRFPIEIYKEPLRGIFTFIIPVGVMMSFPPKALFGALSWQFISFSFLISFLLLFLSLKFWDYALKKYQSFGG